MALRFEDGQPFSQGACTYLDRPATAEERTPRILVPVRIEGIETQAMLDTGGVYLICDPQIADVLDLDPSAGLETDPVRIRGITVAGILHRLSLTLLDDGGHSLEQEVTVFVPNLPPYEVWDLPSIMGWMGCLERLRFAIDPATDMFHFGPVDPLT